MDLEKNQLINKTNNFIVVVGDANLVSFIAFIVLHFEHQTVTVCSSVTEYVLKHKFYNDFNMLCNRI